MLNDKQTHQKDKLNINKKYILYISTLLCLNGRP